MKDWRSIVTMIILCLSIGLILFTVHLKSTSQIYIDTIDDVKEATERDIEEYTRKQARYAAKSIWKCIQWEVEKNWFKTTDEMLLTIRNCGAEYRNGWDTGDFFVFDRISKRMVYDNSPDCLKGWVNRFFYDRYEEDWLENNKQKGECWMHENKEQCEKAIGRLYNVWTTSKQSKIRWQFDDSSEWLESYVIPSMSEWFNGAIGQWGTFNNDQKNVQLQIVVGSQKDEVLSNFENSKKEFNDNKQYAIEYLKGSTTKDTILIFLLIIMSYITIFTIKFK